MCRRLQHCRRCAYLNIAHARPVQPFDQGRELGGHQAHDAVLDLRPAERPFLQALGEQAQTCAISDDQFDSVGALGTNEDRARERIGAQMGLHQCSKPIHTLAEVDRLGGDQDLQPA
jgi:hypothetical protein